jgi:hypothetical protein
MKAASFLDMVTTLSATSENTYEYDSRLTRLISLYSKPPHHLCRYFSNIQKGDKSHEYKGDKLKFRLFPKYLQVLTSEDMVTCKAPKNLNELIFAINTLGRGFQLEFQPGVINTLGISPRFIEVVKHLNK